MNNTSINQDDIFYRAYQNHDRSYEGQFFLAVKTTGIFCRPGCKARLPKRENVEFFASSDAAIKQGYRPCKKCQPLLRSGEQPRWVEQALALLKQDAAQRISDQELSLHGINPARLRRWFQAHHGMTFQAFQRQYRLNRAFSSMNQGARVIDAAFDSGYNSLSGFYDSFQKATGFVPSNSPKNKILAITQLLTPLGPMLAAASDKGLCLLEFHDRKRLQKQIERVQLKLNARMVPGDHALFEEVQRQLDEYFKRQRAIFSIPLDMTGTPFQQQVWQALLDIPFGETRHYQQQAKAIHKPQAVRAVARANAENPLAILVPCHRVIAKSGQLAGYAGGLRRKAYLLDLEQATS
ncbi:MAG: methylated-DNA--[protein]-cysteine S-methyltransferase [Gammaproteobacteria bacterium]|nr:methylated-DNA--[protein]-cysteine S-methyltransferase [Gammaproteobacteria bacterium]